jgi:hypothetical protein
VDKCELASVLRRLCEQAEADFDPNGGTVHTVELTLVRALPLGQAECLGLTTYRHPQAEAAGSL